MRIRKPFAAAFSIVCIFAAGAGFAPSQYEIPSYKQSDKVLHFFTFFIVTTAFYWILETNRRRVLQLTALVCTLGLGVGSEFIQWAIPNGREFDQFDIVANVLGSGLALALSTWYHKRMLERKRAARSYQAVPGEDSERDLELGEGVGEQETGVTGTAAVQEELDNWDENAEDWETTEPGENMDGNIMKDTPTDAIDGKAKRND
ncbi:hypothetical protein EJ05DRAFT_510937 [Pseudovirgaria hyperparasitica]|uniref:VanZ-like domain-containing protein n=1 Tax=Pseudovirgaria hyperparasitica TaxID=470096 RepID=A0A6A6W7C8_9PEZI|nr:uncharacterized protein EJ05DRAFT_510937 [Pseudovirgaria hyperparasitica]KAF2758109.1 hypothetical protein EJ05DRAFT_510937 [Pseudovirgaria hyperparasitica]